MLGNDGNIYLLERLTGEAEKLHFYINASKMKYGIFNYVFYNGGANMIYVMNSVGSEMWNTTFTGVNSIKEIEFLIYAI